MPKTVNDIRAIARTWKEDIGMDIRVALQRENEIVIEFSGQGMHYVALTPSNAIRMAHQLMDAAMDTKQVKEQLAKLDNQ